MRRPDPRRVVDLHGTITSVGFSSGHRFVVGRWVSSPVGPLTDVMWAAPDGHRTLLVPSPEAEHFVTGVYAFDAVEVVAVASTLAPAGGRGGRRLVVTGGPLELSLDAGAPVPIPPSVWPWVTRRIHGPIARTLLGVRSYGTSPTGVEEWYRATSFRRVRAARGTLEGVDLGALAPLDPPTRFGFSEPPRQPSMVGVHPRLRYP